MTDNGTPNIVVYGAPWCGDCKRAKKFFGEHRIAYDWVDIEQDSDGLALVERINEGKRIIPVIMFPDGSHLIEPSNAQLAAKLGLQTTASLSWYDLIVVGSGPAGLTAALYGAREGLDVLVIERGGIGGQAGVTERLDNFPGFPDGINGGEFADRLALQARRFGVEILSAQEVTQLRTDGSARYIQAGDGMEIGAHAILIATGSKYRRLGVPGEDELIGAGVHFCATCDGPFYRGQHVAVIGGGNSAGEESLFLARFADRVTMLVRGSALTASQIVIDKVEENPKIAIRVNTEVRELHGEKKLAGITIYDKHTGTEAQISPAGVFVFIGLTPNTAWLPSEIKRDSHGFIITGTNLETSIPGVFAAGDVRLGSTKQAASAAGEGATAALMIREYLKTV